jgi:predicted dinucleotide-binding enzyme
VVFVGTDIAKAADLADELEGLGAVASSEQAEGDVVVLAVPFTAAPHAVRQHADELAGSVLVDITNPIDISVLEPIEVAQGSAAQLIAEEAPDGARVVKAFNTTLAGPLLAGEVAGQPLDVFLAGDDGDAKERVGRVVSDGGMRPIDVGALARARELEAMAYLHMAAQPALGTAFTSAIKVLAP